MWPPGSGLVPPGTLQGDQALFHESEDVPLTAPVELSLLATYLVHAPDMTQQSYMPVTRRQVLQ